MFELCLNVYAFSVVFILRKLRIKFYRYRTNVQGCFVSLFTFFLRGVSLCEEYNVDAESFIEQWMAFSLNNLNGASPTLENLDGLARKEFSKRAANRVCAPAKENPRAVGTGAGLTVYGAPVAPQYPFTITTLNILPCVVN